MCGCELAAATWVNTCAQCWQKIVPWSGPICGRCGIPFASALAASAESDVRSGLGLCGSCRNGQHEFDLARSYGLYRGNLRLAILQLKFKRRERLGSKLGQLLHVVLRSVEDSLRQETGTGETALLVPVPLHSQRERERGFNQAELLARGLALAARGSSVPSAKGLASLASVSANHRGREPWPPRIETRCLRRSQPTVPQSGLSLAARHENVRGAFEVTTPHLVRDRTVVLVDDVMTTGATLSACAAALKHAGARYVIALTLAHVTPRFPDTLA